MNSTLYKDVVAHTNFDLLLAAAQKKLEQQYQQTPKDSDLLRRLIEIYRKRGLIGEVRKMTEHLQTLNPSEHDNCIKQIFFQEKIFANKLLVKPAPFVIIPDFLTIAEQTSIWETIDAFQNRFKDSQIRNNTNKFRTDREVRHSKVLFREDLEDIASFFLPKITQSIERNYQQLAITPFKPIRKEIQLTLHNDGHFFTIHKDEGTGLNRVITYVYYFHQLPKTYQGGDLLLFDTNEEKDHYAKDYTRIITQNNMLILFPSIYYHQVTPVHLDHDDFRRGRFTINGWFRQNAKS